jgi:hypothetical protein
LRERAVSDPRAAEISFVGCSVLVPWSVLGASTSTRCRNVSLERLYSGLLRLASMDDTVLAGLVEQVLAGDELVSS